MFGREKDLEIWVCNTSRIDPKRKNPPKTGWYNWEVYIETYPREFASKIDHVVYYLHPSFLQGPIETNTGPDFRLKASGWGEFTIDLDIVLYDKKKKRLSHYLKLISWDQDSPLISKTSYKLSKDKDFR